jgi:glycosyltransferase involved in cell wall biosynthesis
MSVEHPLVSVVTPVRNGEVYLRECIESVLAQTYGAWEYVIVDNCSSDRSREIACSYADRDKRIRIHSNQTDLGLLENWNHALRQISPESKYCKVLHADDLLLPACLELMVEAGEANPSVGIIGAYRIDEDYVNLDAMPYKTTFISGREICRRRLLGGRDMFGSPSSLMIRADLVRSRSAFYNEKNLHADSEVCFDLLRTVDFGFVHQVLTYTRRHNESVASRSRRLNTQKASHLLHLVRYGRDFLSPDEYAQQYKKACKTYYRILGEELLSMVVDTNVRRRRKEFWEYHSKALADMGQSLDKSRLVSSIIAVLYNKSLRTLMV